MIWESGPTKQLPVLREAGANGKQKDSSCSRRRRATNPGTLPTRDKSTTTPFFPYLYAPRSIISSSQNKKTRPKIQSGPPSPLRNGYIKQLGPPCPPAWHGDAGGGWLPPSRSFLPPGLKRRGSGGPSSARASIGHTRTGVEVGARQTGVARRGRDNIKLQIPRTYADPVSPHHCGGHQTLVIRTAVAKI